MAHRASFRAFYVLFTLIYVDAAVNIASLQWPVPSQPITGGYNYPKNFKYGSVQPIADGWLFSFSASALSDIVLSLSTQVGGPPQSGSSAKTVEVWIGALSGSYSMIRTCSGPNGLWSCKNLITWDSTVNGASYFSSVGSNNYWIYYTRGRLAVGYSYLPTYIVSRYLQNSTQYSAPQVSDGLWMQLVDVSLNSPIRDIGFGGYRFVVDYANIRLFDSLSATVPLTTYSYSAATGTTAPSPFICVNNQQARLAVNGEIECKSDNGATCLACNAPEPVLPQPAKPCQAGIPMLGRGRFVSIRYIDPNNREFLNLREIEVYDITGRVVSRFKPVIMSSTLLSSTPGSNLVDGDYFSALAHTNNNILPTFMRIDLETDVDIYGIRIWNRADFAYRLFNTILAIEDASQNAVYSTQILSSTPSTNAIYWFSSWCFRVSYDLMFSQTITPVHNRYTMIPAIVPLPDAKKLLLHVTVQTSDEIAVVLAETQAGPSVSQNYYEIRINQLIHSTRIIRISRCSSTTVLSCNVLSTLSSPITLNSATPQEFWLWYNDGAIAVGPGTSPSVLILNQLITFSRQAPTLNIPNRNFLLLSGVDPSPITGVFGIGYAGWFADATVSEVAVMPPLDEIAPPDFFSCVSPVPIPNQNFFLSGTNFFGLQPQPYTSNSRITFTLTAADAMMNIYAFSAGQVVTSSSMVTFQTKSGNNWINSLSFTMDQIAKGEVQALPGQSVQFDGIIYNALDANAWSLIVSFSNGLFRQQSMMCPPMLLNDTHPPFEFSSALPVVATTMINTISATITRTGTPLPTKKDTSEETFLFLPVSYAYYVYGGGGGGLILIIVLAVVIVRRHRKSKNKSDFMLAGDVKASDLNLANLTNVLDQVLQAPTAAGGGPTQPSMVGMPMMAGYQTLNPALGSFGPMTPLSPVFTASPPFAGGYSPSVKQHK